MAIIPIHNETAYALTEAMTEAIIRDAHEHFGDDVRVIRVQAGRERHALNARTREVRYAFSPQDFGVGAALSSTPARPAQMVAPPRRRRGARPRAAQAPFEVIEAEEMLDPGDMAIDGLEQRRDDDVAEDDSFKLDNENEEEDDEENEEEDDEEEDDD